MEIIPVIDVMGGKVVHARGGNRADYPLLASTITMSHQPRQVIKDVINYYPFATLYIADLDAIVAGEIDATFYADLSNSFPEIEFWLDAGIKSQPDYLMLADYPNISPVIGSETLNDISWLKNSEVQKKSILSLDFKQGTFLGNEFLLSHPESWPDRVIAMNLDCIASKLGPDMKLLAKLKSQSSSDVIASGGVRSEQDLILLQTQGIERVLVASALHDGRLSKDTLSSIT